MAAPRPIGMSQVCSVNFETNIQAGTHVNKGDMMGYFLFGGSDFIMIFQKEAGFNLEVSKDTKYSRSYQHLLVGEKYRVFTGSKQ